MYYDEYLCILVLFFFCMAQVSANVSGRGSPNISGRDTPSSQVTEGDIGVSNPQPVRYV